MLLQCEHLLEEHAWIANEKGFFGKKNGTYDFEVTNPHEAHKKISKLEERKDKLLKTVNMRAMNMLGKAEEQVNISRCCSPFFRDGCIIYLPFNRDHLLQMCTFEHIHGVVNRKTLNEIHLAFETVNIKPC